MKYLNLIFSFCSGGTGLDEWIQRLKAFANNLEWLESSEFILSLKLLLDQRKVVSSFSRPLVWKKKKKNIDVGFSPEKSDIDIWFIA